MIDADTWQPLPMRARRLFVLTDGLGWGLAAIPAVILAAMLLPRPLPAIPVAIAALVLMPAWGVWMALRRYRYTRWLVDETGIGHRRGRMWQVETRVPRTRVQHVDLKHGPLERAFGLATLVVHTAGSRDSAVAVSGLDAGEAVRLRDLLARQIDQDDADDHATR